MREPIFELGSVEGVESPSLILSHLDPEPSLPSLCHARWLIAEETQQSLEEEKSLETCSWSTVLAESLQKQRKLGEEYRARCRHLHLSEPASICSEASEPSNKLKRSRSGRSTNVFSSANDIGGALKASEPSSSSRALQQPCNNAVAYETALSSLLWLETVREDIPDFSAKGGVSLETLKSSPVLQRLQGVQEEIGRLDFFIQRVEAMRLLEEEQFLHHVQEIREQKKKSTGISNKLTALIHWTELVMSSSSHFHRNCRVLHFTNEAGEVFKIQVFLPGPKYSSVEEASAEKLPVVLCVHGAGMTSDNFIRLAQVLAPCPADEHQNEEKIQKDADHRELKKVALQEFVDRSLDHIRPPMNMYSTSEVPSSVSLERPARSRDSNGKPPMTLYRTRQYSEEELSDSEGGLPPRLPCSGPSSAMTAERDELPENSLEVCVVSYDMRCHGDSTYAGGESSLTLEVLVKDFHAIQNYLVEKLFPDSLVFVVGHSLGASVVSSALSRVVGVPYTVPKQIAGVVLLDASERVAKRSLHTMEDFLKKRPCSFNSPQEAVEWFLGQGGMQTREAAEISVPPLLKEDPKSSGKEKRFVWKTDLSQTASVWNTWFDALNANFLSVPLPKILCLSSIEMLNADKELIVGQMQGKFQFEVPSQSGHFIHDDVPRFLAKKLLRFIDRTVTMKKRIKNGVLVDLPR